MSRLKQMVANLMYSVQFWRVKKKMPGVADQIKKTQLRQEQKARKSDMQELLLMAQEGRLHEADERQLETLKLTLELNRLFEQRQTPTPVASEDLIDAVKQAISEGLIQGNVRTTPAEDPDRPEMRHVSLVDLTQEDTEVTIAHKGGVSREVEGEDSSGKLEKLKKLKKGRVDGR